MSSSRKLSDHLTQVWAVLSSRPSGLVTDVDGTISPIVDRPEMARLDARALDGLRRLAPRLDLVAAVSGRSIAQLMDMVRIGDLVYVGNHGLEWWEAGAATVVPDAVPYLPAIAATLRWLRARLAIAGVLVEDKGASGTLHYRLSPNPADARLSILQALDGCASARGLRVADGRMVVNLLPPIRSDKGAAVERLVHRRKLRGVVYLGDDATDLDAFRALRSMRETGVCATLTIAVASDEGPADVLREADYTLDGVEAVASFLEQAAEWALRLFPAAHPLDRGG